MIVKALRKTGDESMMVQFLALQLVGTNVLRIGSANVQTAGKNHAFDVTNKGRKESA
jgi:hypothetical protein